MSTPPVFVLENVTKEYRASQQLFDRTMLTAVDGVSLQIEAGEVLGIVGETGSGKTTLSKLMLGLIRPTSGAILLDGKPIASHPRHAVARRVQFVFQDPLSSLNPRRAIGATLIQPLRIHGVGTARERAARARELLDIVRLPSRVFDAFPAQLSGGQRQRVAIARALALKPQVLICDEPTSALDVSVQAQILNLLLDLRKELGLTYVLVSHNLAVIEHMSTKVAVMYLGRIVELNAAERLFAAPRHPYTRVLLGSTMTVAPRGSIPALRLGGTIPSPTAIPRGCRFHPRCPEVLPQCASEPPPLRRDGAGFAECHLIS
ncbi:MAG TPA: ABC transporter ATP-binding protein [Xanthobacteraceae bacterium]|nr:ABC transporter ATP-binding protein [Xanthobacteraceae bacterium]